MGRRKAKTPSLPSGPVGCTEKVKGKTASCGIAQAEIYFRPLISYDGEFGFDWMRVGDIDYNRAISPIDLFVMNNYSALVAGGKGVTIPSGSSLPVEAYKKLEKEYKAIPINGESKNYHTHWLAIFPKKLADSFNGSFTHPAGAELQHRVKLNVFIKVKDIANKPDRIIFLNKDPENLEILTSASRNHKEVAFLPCHGITSTVKELLGAIIINSKGVLKNDTAIEAYAVKGDNQPIFAGVLVVSKNHPTNACKNKNVLVALIKTNITGTNPKDGKDVFSNTHEKIIYHIMHQCLLYGEVEKNETVIDLTNDIRFRLPSSLSSTDSLKVDAGKYCNSTGVMPLPSIIPDEAALFAAIGKPFNYLTGLLPKKYRNYAKLFTFDESWAGSPGVSGVAKDFASNMAANFREIASFRTTPAHEMAHSLGLRHTFSDTDAPYIFNTDTDTDNIMSYSDREPPLTWRWQWKMINTKLK